MKKVESPNPKGSKSVQIKYTILGWTFPIRIRTHREAKDIPNKCVKILSYQQVKSS